MKHAVLITANYNAAVVRQAISLLDHTDFTVFLLIDKKSKEPDSAFLPSLKHAACRVLPRITINWAGYSQIRAELLLMEAALNEGGFSYLHFLQNADLPLKTPAQIDTFFTAHRGEEFLDFQPVNYEYAKYKALCRHWFVDCRFYRNHKVLHILNHGLAKIQYRLIDKTMRFYHGSALFSVTSEFASYVVGQKKAIEKQYRHSLACDEVFLHTVFMSSPFRDRLSDLGGVRLIDWERREGNSPHTFTMDDRAILSEAIENPNLMFGRKFTASRDSHIVDFVTESLTCENGD